MAENAHQTVKSDATPATVAKAIKAANAARAQVVKTTRGGRVVAVGTQPASATPEAGAETKAAGK